MWQVRRSGQFVKESVLAVGIGLLLSQLTVFGSSRVYFAVAAALVFAVLFFWAGRQGRVRTEFFTRGLLWTIVLSPNIPLVPGVPAIRLEDLLLAVLLLAIVAFRHQEVLLAPPGFKLAIALGITIVVSITLSANPAFRDLMELVKLAKYVLLMWVGYNSHLDESRTVRLLKDLCVVTIITSVVAVAQYLNALNINDWFSRYYAPSQVEGLISYGRVTGTTANPNQFGLLLVFPIGVALTVLMSPETDAYLRRLCRVTLPLALFTVILTASRTAAVAIAVLVAILLLRGQTTTRFSRRLLVGILVAGVTLLAVNFAPDFWISRMSTLTDGSISRPLLSRTIKWEVAMASFVDAPVFGLGPGKAAATGAIDNEFVVILYRYGTVGLALFLGWLGSLLLRLGRPVTGHPHRAVLRMGVFGGQMASFVFMATAALFYDIQDMSLFSLLAGVALSQGAVMHPQAEVPVGRGNHGRP